jgi:ubiquinone/menaquinone biosynthesis C-methylase UbiE
MGLGSIDLKYVSILDLGCGIGYTLVRLSTLLSSKARLVGIDIDRAAISRAESLAKQTHGKADIEFRCIDAEKVDFRNDSFDIILANLSFSVFRRPTRVAALVSRILKPNGRLVASEVNSLSLLGKIGQVVDTLSENHYYDLFSPTRLTNLFVPYGFRRTRTVKVPLMARLMNHSVRILARLSPVFLVELSKRPFLYRSGIN